MYKNLIAFSKNTQKAAALRTRNESKQYGRKENGIATYRAYPVFDGEQQDVQHLTEEFLKAVTSLKNTHWVPHGISNADRFRTIRDLSKDFSPLQDAIDKVIDADYPNANQQINNAIPNLVKKTIYELTKQASAGDKVRDHLRNVQYLNLVDDDNKLWNPRKVLDRFEEVLKLAARLQTELPDWTGPRQLSCRSCGVIIRRR